MEVQFDQTKADVLAFNRHVYLKRKISWVIIGVYPLAALYLLRDQDPGRMFGIALLTFAVMASLIFGLQLLVARIRLSSGKYAAFLGPRTYRIDDSGVEVETPDSTSKLGWKLVQKVSVTKRHLFLHLTPLNALIIPKRAFPTEAGFAEFAAGIRGRLEGKH